MDRILNILTFLLFAAVLQATVYSASVPNHKNDFLITRWNTDDGLPQNSVTSLIQSRDGYIWLTTFGGLARFDGIHFTVFDSAKEPGLTSNRLLSLLEDSRGIIWIGAESGEIFYLKDGSIKEFRISTVSNRINVWGFAEDAEGRIYAASDGGLERFEVAKNGEPLPDSAFLISGKRAFQINQDDEQRVWVRDDGVYKVVKGDALVAGDEAGFAIPDWMSRLKFGPGKKAIACDGERLGVVDGLEFRKMLDLDATAHLGALSLGLGDGAFWFQQAGELYEIRGETIERHDISSFVTRGSRKIFFDREGNMWIASTAEGLVKLSPRNISLLSDITGREFISVYSITEDSEGSVWFANNRLNRMRDSKAEEMKNVTGDSLPLLRSVATGRDGKIWGGGPDGLVVSEGRGLRAVPGTADLDIKALFFDDRGRLWIGHETGIGTYVEGSFKNVGGELQLPPRSVHFITQTRDGAIWAGGRSGAFRIADGEVKRLTTKDGLAADFVRDIYEDADGTIWLATYGGGISRLKDGRLNSVTEANGLLNNSVSRILVDDNGKFWLLTNLGVMAVEKETLERVADGRESYLTGAVFGTGDGMPSSEANGSFQPAGFKDSEGRLWFPMLRDVVIIDPRRLDKNAPKVVIEGAWSRSGEPGAPPIPISFDPGKEFEIQNELRNIEISFTGLSFRKPESTRFFYKLEGLDKDWIDAGSTRSVFYPYLPHGNYTFRVRALGGNGVWSETVAEMPITVPRSFAESPWIFVLAIGLVVLVGIVAYRLRVRQLERIRSAQTEFAKRLLNVHEGERRRMASELHDGLGQNLLLIRNWASLASSENADRSEMADYVKKISSTAADTLEETRAIVQNLGPQNLRRFGLTEAIVNMIEQLEDASNVPFETRLENIDGLFPEDAEISIYRIVQECLNNVVKHSKSPTGLVEIRRSDDRITILVEDKGIGFDTERNSVDVAGIGLMGISQRVSFLAGDLEIDSVKGRGTTVQVKIGIPDAKRDQNSDSG